MFLTYPASPASNALTQKINETPAQKTAGVTGMGSAGVTVMVNAGVTSSPSPP